MRSAAKIIARLNVRLCQPSTSKTFGGVMLYIVTQSYRQTISNADNFPFVWELHAALKAKYQFSNSAYQTNIMPYVQRAPTRHGGS
jgi:hypothetical protein